MPNQKNMKNLKIYTLLVLAFAIGCYEDKDGNPPPLDLPSLSITDLNLTEGDEDFIASFEVTLTGTNTTNVVVSLASLSRSAEAEVDYKIINPETMIFAPGETSKSIQVEIVGDELLEGKEEFELVLFNPINATISKGTGLGVIEDDEIDNSELIIPSTGYTTPLTYPGFHIVWKDEFDGTSLDLNNWTFEIGDGCPNNCGWGNNESQYYRQENTKLVNGHLVIEARKQNFAGKEYTSSRIVTKGKKEFKYGRIDIRAALPEGQGIWPALWMLGANFNSVGWPACGEMDIMELIGSIPNRSHATVHFGENLSQHEFVGSSITLPGSAKFSDEFHVFSMNWTQNQAQFLMDNQVVLTITPADLNGQPYPFNEMFFFIFNIAVGGNWPGYPDATTAFPQRLIVDYVRVFQLN